MQSRSGIIAMHVNRTEEVIFPLIPHVTPIWPPEKRIENVKARRANFRRLVRNKMILFKFLQSINPTFKDFVSEVVEKVDDEHNIIALTRNFHEEQRIKTQRIYEIQMEAFHREERKKSAWAKVRENEYYGGLQKLPRTSMVATKGNSNILTDQTLMKDWQLTPEKRRHTSKIEDHGASTKDQHRELSKAQTPRRRKDDEVVFPPQNVAIYLPQIYRQDKEAKRPVNDPRFERLLTSLVPTENRTETEFRDIGTGRSISSTKGRERTLQSRLSGKSLHEKWLETMEPKYNEKNVSTSFYN